MSPLQNADEEEVDIGSWQEQYNNTVRENRRGLQELQIEEVKTE